MTDTDWRDKLRELRVGDPVAVFGGFRGDITSLRRVEKITKFHIIVTGGGKYRIRTGGSVHGDAWNRDHIEAASDEHREAWERARIVAALNRQIWESVPIETLRRVIEVLGSRETI